MLTLQTRNQAQTPLLPLTPQSWEVSWRLVLSAFDHTRSSGPILESMKESLFLNTFNSGKRKTCAYASEITAAGYSYGLLPKLGWMKVMLAPHLSVALLFSRCFCIHFLIWFGLVTSCPPTHIWSSWHASCPHPGHRKPYLAEGQGCAPASALSQHDAAP